MTSCDVWFTLNDVSEEPVSFIPFEDGVCMFLWMVVNFFPDHTASYPRPYSHVLEELQISRMSFNFSKFPPHFLGNPNVHYRSKGHKPNSRHKLFVWDPSCCYFLLGLSCDRFQTGLPPKYVISLNQSFELHTKPILSFWLYVNNNALLL